MFVFGTNGDLLRSIKIALTERNGLKKKISLETISSCQ